MTICNFSCGNPPDIRADYHRAFPLNRYGTEAEIALIYFLSGDRASYVNGQIVAVDGEFELTGIELATLQARAG